MQRPYLTIDRARVWQQSLLAQVLHIVERHIPEKLDRRAMARELEDLFFCRGVWIVTEADRAKAGLEPRDAQGWTLEELQILESRIIGAMQSTAAPLVFRPGDCPQCGFLGEGKGKE